MQLTADAEETRKRWEAVPALASVSPLGGPRPGASVLAVTSGPGGAPRALVAVQRYGTGRAMVFTGEAVVAVAHDAPRQRSLVRHLLVPVGALARAHGPGSGHA